MKIRLRHDAPELGRERLLERDQMWRQLLVVELGKRREERAALVSAQLDDAAAAARVEAHRQRERRWGAHRRKQCRERMRLVIGQLRPAADRELHPHVTSSLPAGVSTQTGESA